MSSFSVSIEIIEGQAIIEERMEDKFIYINSSNQEIGGLWVRNLVFVDWTSSLLLWYMACSLGEIDQLYKCKKQEVGPRTLHIGSQMIVYNVNRSWGLSIMPMYEMCMFDR